MSDYATKQINDAIAAAGGSIRDALNVALAENESLRAQISADEYNEAEGEAVGLPEYVEQLRWELDTSKAEAKRLSQVEIAHQQEISELGLRLAELTTDQNAARDALELLDVLLDRANELMLKALPAMKELGSTGWALLAAQWWDDREEARCVMVGQPKPSIDPNEEQTL